MFNTVFQQKNKSRLGSDFWGLASNCLRGLSSLLPEFPMTNPQQRYCFFPELQHFFLTTPRSEWLFCAYTPLPPPPGVLPLLRTLRRSTVLIRSRYTIISIQESEHPERDFVVENIFDVVFDNVALFGIFNLLFPLFLAADFEGFAFNLKV